MRPSAVATQRGSLRCDSRTVFRRFNGIQQAQHFCSLGGGNRGLGQGCLGLRCRQALGDDVPHVRDQPDHCRSNRPESFHRSSLGESFASFGELALGRGTRLPFALPDQVSRLSALCRDDDDQAPHRAPRCHGQSGQGDEVNPLVMQFSGIDDVLKDSLRSRLDLRGSGRRQRRRQGPPRPGSWPPPRTARSVWSRSPRIFRYPD